VDVDSHFLYSQAKRIIERQLVFWIHFAIFAGVNLTLISINLFSSPQTIWFLYPLFSWGLALYFHFIFSFVFHDENLDKWKRVRRSKRKAEAIVFFWVHVCSYVGVCLFLVAINLISGDPTFWAIWPIIGWGIGLLTHGLSAWIFTEKYFKKIAAKIQSQDLIEARVYLKVHLLTFLATNLVILFLNLLLDPQNLISLWIAVGWGIGLACHWLWIAVNRGHRIKKWKQKRALELMKQLKEEIP